MFHERRDGSTVMTVVSVELMVDGVDPPVGPLVALPRDELRGLLSFAEELWDHYEQAVCFHHPEEKGSQWGCEECAPEKDELHALCNRILARLGLPQFDKDGLGIAAPEASGG